MTAAVPDKARKVDLAQLKMYGWSPGSGRSGAWVLTLPFVPVARRRPIRAASNPVRALFAAARPLPRCARPLSWPSPSLTIRTPRPRPRPPSAKRPRARSVRAHLAPIPAPQPHLAIRPRLNNVGGGLLMSGAMRIRRALPLRHRASALRPSTLRGLRLGPTPPHPAPRTCVAHSFARSRCVGQDHPHRHEGKCWRGVYFDPCPRAVPGCVSAHHGCRRSLFGGLGQRPGTPACHGAGGAVRTRPGHPACVLHTVRPAPRDHSHRSRAGLTVRHMNGAARTLQRGWWFLCCRCRWQLVAAPPTPSSITRPRYAREHRWGGGVGPRPQSALKPDRPYRDASSVADRRRRANSQRASKVTVMSPPEVRMHSGRRTDASSTVVLVLTMHVNAASLHAERTKRRLGHCVGRTWSRKRAHRAGCAPFDRIVLTRGRMPVWPNVRVHSYWPHPARMQVKGPNHVNVRLHAHPPPSGIAERWSFTHCAETGLCGHAHTTSVYYRSIAVFVFVKGPRAMSATPTP